MKHSPRQTQALFARGVKLPAKILKMIGILTRKLRRKILWEPMDEK